MSLGDKVVALGCALVAAWWVGFDRGYDAARKEAGRCSAYLEDGRPLMDTFIDTAGRKRCLYREPTRLTSTTIHHGGRK